MNGPVDTDTFRRLLGSFTTGVTVITTLDPDDAPAGMTASAVTAVSLDPPLLLVCVDRAADFHAAIASCTTFVVNVLARNQEAISQRFARKGTDKFDGVAFSRHESGPPILEGALAHIVCERWSDVPAGDHTVFVARVIGGSAADRAPLLYFRGGYRTFA